MDNGDGTFRKPTKEELLALSGLALSASSSYVPTSGGGGVRAAKKLSETQRCFAKGEELEIKGSRFRVVSIGRHEMHLRLLPSIVPLEGE